MTLSREALIVGEFYHIFNRSIAGYKIFNNDSEFLRMKNIIQYYQIEERRTKFSQSKQGNKGCFKMVIHNNKKLVDIICYCLMPTHIHLILKQVKDNGISNFMQRILNSYSHYFNIKHNRKGPLWEGRFKKVRVETDEQLLHLTRYIHLNPSTVYFVNSPIEWPYSSYGEYISMGADRNGICDSNNILDIRPDSYKIFVEDGISYQRGLAKIKDLIIE